MFDIGWTELLVIGIVALIVVGPKDLPGMFRTLGRFTAKARKMAREFSRAMEDAAEESGVGDMAKDLKNMTSAKNLGLNTIKDAAGKFEEWDPMGDSAPSQKGPATKALSEERARAAKEIKDATARKVAKKTKAGKAGSASAKPAGQAQKPAAKPAPKSAKKPARKPVAKPAAGKAAPKATRKPAKAASARQAAAAKPPTTKTRARKPAARKPAGGRAG